MCPAKGRLAITVVIQDRLARLCQKSKFQYLNKTNWCTVNNITTQLEETQHEENSINCLTSINEQ